MNVTYVIKSLVMAIRKVSSTNTTVLPFMNMDACHDLSTVEADLSTVIAKFADQPKDRKVESALKKRLVSESHCCGKMKDIAYSEHMHIIVKRKAYPWIHTYVKFMTLLIN